jgi:chaperonin GroES
MNIKPLADRVVVKVQIADEVTAGGIILPDSAKEKPQQGEVVAIGTGKITDSGKVVAMTVKVGDTVIYGKYSGTNVTLDYNDYLILDEKDIFAII